MISKLHMAIKVIHPKTEFTDERGGIARIVDSDKFTFRAVLRITSKAGSIRSNHYHRSDYHYIYVESGKCEYSEKPSDDPNAKVETVILESGDVVLSKPGIIHAVKFLEDSVMYAITTETREHELYEEDTKRIKIIE